MANFATRVSLHLTFAPNPLLQDSPTDFGPPGETTNPNVDLRFARTWSINCFAPDYNVVGEITVQQNPDNTVHAVTMKLFGSDDSNKSKWWGFTKTDGFSNEGDPSSFSVTGVTEVSGPNGSPAGIDPPKVPTISGSPEARAGEKKYCSCFDLKSIHASAVPGHQQTSRAKFNRIRTHSVILR